jgi:hypothetical protein
LPAEASGLLPLAALQLWIGLDQARFGFQPQRDRFQWLMDVRADLPINLCEGLL